MQVVKDKLCGSCNFGGRHCSVKFRFRGTQCSLCLSFGSLQMTAPPARNVAQPVVDLRLGFTPARAASTKQTMAGSFGSFWEVWQFVQQRHRRVTEVTFGEIDCRGSCRVVHLVSHSPFLCLTQMGHNVFRAFAVNF